MEIKNSKNYLNVKENHIYKGDEFLESTYINEYIDRAFTYCRYNSSITLICKYKNNGKIGIENCTINSKIITHLPIDSKSVEEAHTKIHYFIWGCIQLFLTNENDIQFIYY